MIKGALFDIDDTLFSHDTNEVPKATIRALDKLRAKGIKIGICTSRIAAEMADLPEELWKRIDCKIVGTGATTIVEGKYIKSYTIDEKDARSYVDYFEKHDISYHYTDINGDVYYWGDIDRVNKGHWLSYAMGNVKFKPFEDEEITNLFYYHGSDEDVKNIAAINPGALISNWGNSGNICAPLIDKSFGLLKFCQVFSFTTDEVVAAGDGVNDDVMLEMAGIGIAVDDAKENTKAAADYVCRKPIEDGGLYDAFVDLGLIEEDKYDISMFCFDNDSTLFDHGSHRVHEETIDVLRKLKDKGYILALNTSRSYAEMENIPKQLLDLMDVLILINGAYIVKDGQVEISCLEEADVNLFIDFFEKHDVTYRYCTKDGGGYLNREDEEHAAIFERLYGMRPAAKKYEGEEVLQLLYYATGALREEIMSLSDHNEYSILNIAGEISPKGKNKGEAMIDVAASYGIAPEKICAFGDSGNDIEMLKMAGLGIAMGNATRECKKAADYVTAPVNEEGISEALLHFGFLKKE